MKRYLENKKSDIQHVNLPFLSAIKKKQLSPEREEERSTCHTVAVPLHRSTICWPKIIQIFSKTSHSKACSIDTSSLFLVSAILFEQRPLFHHKHHRIWPLDLYKQYKSGIILKTRG